MQEDNSYLVSEDIHVEFQNSRHGISRYIPRKGIITEVKEDGNMENIPYYARFDKKKQKAPAPVDVTIENGNKVFRLGNPDELVYGAQEYQLQYEVTPVTSKGYDNAYYNIFPTGWQNEIPKGSTFSITFPKKINKDSLQIYYGRYGEQMNAKDIIDFTWNGNTISGSFTQALPVGTGMTFYIPLEAGYFTGVSTMCLPNLILVLCAVFALIIMLSMYFFFGKDKPIIPSIQYQPPKRLDSAAAGYIVDGNASDTDTISLLLYWADQGYLKVREQEETLSFEKVKEMKMLTLPTPDWYETEEGRINYSNYYLLHRVVHTNLEQIKTSITFTPQPVVSSSGTSGSSGGGYSGGGFFGGGFGGGGGGSW